MYSHCPSSWWPVWVRSTSLTTAPSGMRGCTSKPLACQHLTTKTTWLMATSCPQGMRWSTTSQNDLGQVPQAALAGFGQPGAEPYQEVTHGHRHHLPLIGISENKELPPMSLTLR